jgi:hypothetical protein
MSALLRLPRARWDEAVAELARFAELHHGRVESYQHSDELCGECGTDTGPWRSLTVARTMQPHDALEVMGQWFVTAHAVGGSLMICRSTETYHISIVVYGGSGQ